MDDEAMARLEGGLAAAVKAAAASKPNTKERKQQLLNFKFRYAMWHHLLAREPCTSHK